jgi:hypothetical protein
MDGNLFNNGAAPTVTGINANPTIFSVPNLKPMLLILLQA